MYINTIVTGIKSKKTTYWHWLAKYLLVLILLSNVLVASVALDNSLESLLHTSPSIDATEYTLITHNNLALTLSYLEVVELQIDESLETDIEKQIRKAHIYYLRSFAYVYHQDDTIRTSSRNKFAQEEIGKVLAMAEHIIAQRPNYSDILRVAAVSSMLYGKTGISGIISIVQNKKEVLDMVHKALLLNPDNMMARVVLNNFDSLAPIFVGANPARGLKAISTSLDPALPPPIQFEVLMSRYYAYTRNKDFVNTQKAIDELHSLYPLSWRLQTLLE